MSIRALSFTGSTRTGQAIAIAAASSNLKKVIFELGGKSPALIFPDADIERAARETEHSIMWNSGQTCMANSRIYVHESIKDQFIDAFVAHATKRKLGDPVLKETMNGPQADKTQFETVQKFIATGRQDPDTTTITPFSPPKPPASATQSLFVSPTIMLNTPTTSPLSTSEIFGPVVLINTFTTESEAVDLANATEYGLYAAVYTRDLERAMRVGKKLESGMVGVNCTGPTGCWDLPFGGWKASGTGREGLLDSLDEWCEVKTMYVRVGSD